MSTPTPELGLQRAVDTDDTADYLTISLSNTLGTVDGLFNNVTGHTHSGAHQGGGIATIPASAIPDGSITSAKIADGTILNTDIAPGTIGSSELQVGAAIAQLGSTQGISAFSTTTSGSYVGTGLGVTATSSGIVSTFTRIACTVTFSQSTLAGAARLAIFRDGVVVIGALGLYHNAAAGQNLTFHLDVIETVVVPAGVHTWELRVNNLNAGTLACDGATYNTFSVLEYRR